MYGNIETYGEYREHDMLACTDDDEREWTVFDDCDPDWGDE